MPIELTQNQVLLISIAQYMAKMTCEAAKRFPMSFLKKRKFFAYGYNSGTVNWSFNGQPTGEISIIVFSDKSAIRTFYTYTDQYDVKTQYDYRIPMTATPCYFGGFRYWFMCPSITNGMPCNTRVGVLYMGNRQLRCRRCCGLAYASQQQTHTKKWEPLRRILTLEARISDKERETRVKYWKGQPTKRYQKLLKAYDRLERLSPIVEDLRF